MDGSAEGKTPHVTSNTCFSLSSIRIIAVDLVRGKIVNQVISSGDGSRCAATSPHLQRQEFFSMLL